jgi:hypothetical protein
MLNKTVAVKGLLWGTSHGSREKHKSHGSAAVTRRRFSAAKSKLRSNVPVFS